MFPEAGGSHHIPYFHAWYRDQAGVFVIDPVELIAGELPQHRRRLVEAWAELHQEELRADWAALHAGRRPQPIDPLK